MSQNPTISSVRASTAVCITAAVNVEICERDVWSAATSRQAVDDAAVQVDGVAGHQVPRIGFR